MMASLLPFTNTKSFLDIILKSNLRLELIHSSETKKCRWYWSSLTVVDSILLTQRKRSRSIKRIPNWPITCSIWSQRHRNWDPDTNIISPASLFGTDIHYRKALEYRSIYCRLIAITILKFNKQIFFAIQCCSILYELIIIEACIQLDILSFWGIVKINSWINTDPIKWYQNKIYYLSGIDLSPSCSKIYFNNFSSVYRKIKDDIYWNTRQ